MKYFFFCVGMETIYQQQETLRKIDLLIEGAFTP